MCVGGGGGGGGCLNRFSVMGRFRDMARIRG